ncbi:MAG: protein-export chaperone SecB [Deltaproteobacteria bacterium]|jgi:preprotein translocase subunit SecB|nr:protein-export chaperone SecB [Deltaproteobacteria bacterium]
MRDNLTPVRYDMVKLRLLKSIFFVNPSFTDPPEGQVASLALSIKNAGSFAEAENEARFVMSFQALNSPQAPFALEVEFGAVFALSAPVHPRDQDYYLNVLFPQVVFPFLREYVAETTRRGGFPPLLLNVSLSPEPKGSAGDPPDSLPVVAKWTH